MASSSKGGALSLDVYYNGYFSLKPLTYHNADMLTTTVDVTPLTSSELKNFVQNNIGSVVCGLYYFSNGLKCIKSDDDFRLFVEKWQSTDERIIALYVSHKNESLIEYSGDYVLVILNPATYYKDSDDESDVASLDHLSEGEEELRQVRIKERQLLDEKKKTNEIVVFDESKLVLENESDDNEDEVDPLFSDLGDSSQKEKPHVEPEVNSDEDMPMSDEDEIVFDPNKRDYPIHDPNIHWKLKKPRLGELYADLDQVKDCLTFYSVANGYQLWYEKSDSEKLLVRCGFDEKNRRKKKLPRDPNKPCCPFRLRAVKMHDGKSWHIRTLVNEHTCSRQCNLGYLVTSKWIARQFVDKIRMYPDMKVVDLQEMVMKKYRVKTSHNQCSRARRIAIYSLKQNVGDQYERLVNYAGELRQTNPGTTVQLRIDPLMDGTHMFNSFYICFHNLKQGWKAGCRKVIGMDGCFLKGVCQGQLLAAIGRDGNNQIYPIAWAVVQVENSDTWEWFIKLLAKDLELGDGKGVTFISDGHKGIYHAVKRVVPLVEHRLCARHIYANFSKVYPGVLFRQLFWQASKCANHQRFLNTMEEIKNASEAAYQYLMDKDPWTWSRSYFKEGIFFIFVVAYFNNYIS